MRNVLLMGVNWNSPCGALSRWCGMTIVSAWRSVLVKRGQEIVVVNKKFNEIHIIFIIFFPATRVIVCGWSVRETGNQFGVALHGVILHHFNSQVRLLV